jgi:hypothetical protein
MCLVKGDFKHFYLWDNELMCYSKFIYEILQTPQYFWSRGCGNKMLHATSLLDY